MIDVPELHPLFRYFGSKWKLAVHYPEPRYPLIVEPFAGAAGYATRYHKRGVILCEANPRIAGLWDFLIHAHPDEVREIPILQSGDRIPDEWPDPWRSLVGLWGTLSVAHPVNWIPPVARKTPQNFWSEKRRETIAKSLQWIRHWEVFSGSAFDLPVSEIGPATYFVDPPYQDRKKVTGGCYRTPPMNFERLAKWCAGLQGQAIICEGAQADWLPFRDFRDVCHNTPRNTRNGVIHTKAREWICLLTDGELDWGAV